MSVELTSRIVYAEGDESPVAELLFGEHVWCELRLENVRVDRRGRDRLSEAKVVLHLRGSHVSIDAGRAVLAIESAREGLEDIELGRGPTRIANQP